MCGIFIILVCSISIVTLTFPVWVLVLCIVSTACCVMSAFLVCELPFVIITLLCAFRIIICLSYPILIITAITLFCLQIVSIPCCCCCLVLIISCILAFDAVIASLFGTCAFIITSPILVFPVLFRIVMLTFPSLFNLWRNLPLRLTYPEITYLIERYCRLIMFRLSQLNVFLVPFSLVENLIWYILRKNYG